jgi:hypothetical protein
MMRDNNIAELVHRNSNITANNAIDDDVEE